ncbi:MAG TPA: 16S rRNA (cytosine(1402)-N(4))-methyltransferase RsmH [Alphaproteobacteria bacterium]|jgi:16S rRNA (cytosine1402-N4)-methyltransferase|nr:16S rRNA (cytosine(1402)-N(4))-methyltransferase RsmH [Alphaproteobacteria bacterium]
MTRAPQTLPGGHVPVLLPEVMAALSPRDGGIYVDGTFGAGGYTRAILESCHCTVWAIDRDPDAIRRAESMARDFDGRLHPLQGRFGDMDRLLAERGVSAVDGVALDVGVSSPQLDEAERGFSFRVDGPLDMRMEQAGASAADIVNTADEAMLADILHHYGEERRARAIARAITRARAESPITRTQQLVAVVHRAIGPRSGEVDSATRTFQALRIHVNDELGELERGLSAAERLLAPGGRLAVVSFHSLEDRTVKSFLSLRAGSSARPSRHQPSLSSRGTTREAAPPFSLLGRKPVRPTDEECARNPRARSARLRAAIRTDAPPVPLPVRGGVQP